MNRDILVTSMTGLLKEAVDQEGEHHEITVAPDSPLVGAEAILSSMGLVSYVMDIEATLEEEHDLQLTLVNENALSRSESPFRSVDALADYVIELAAESAESAA